MIVRCLRNTVSSLSEEQARHVSESVHQDEVDLVIGQTYGVLGLTYNRGVPWFLICESESANYPIAHCAFFFEMQDASVPIGWQLVLKANNLGYGSILPLEWASDISFLERLVDGDEEAVLRFNNVKQKYL